MRVRACTACRRPVEECTCGGTAPEIEARAKLEASERVAKLVEEARA
jgi:DTW domain-containing protein YfiP